MTNPRLDWLKQILSKPEAAERTIARAHALNALGAAYWTNTNSPDTRVQLEEALAIGVELGDQLSVATSLRYLGLVANLQGDYQEAHSFLERSIAIGRESGADGKSNNSEALAFLGEVAANERDAARAQALFAESVTILRETQDRRVIAYALRRLGQLERDNGDLEKATTYCKESLTLNVEFDHPRGVAACLAAFAGLAVARRQFHRAAQLFGAVQSLLDSIGVRLLQADTIEYDRNVAFLRAQMNQTDFAAGWSEGREMSMEQAVAYALDDRLSENEIVTSNGV